jgi:hypothetical protein
LTTVYDDSELQRSLNALAGSLDSEMSSALDRVLGEVAARIIETKTYTDRTGQLQASTQPAGQEGAFTSDNLTGFVGFAATSSDGFEYGLSLEFGTANIAENVWMFARRSADEIVEGTDAFERAAARAIANAGLS